MSFLRASASVSVSVTTARGPLARRQLLSALIGLALCGWGGHAAAATGASAEAAAGGAMDASFDRSMLPGAGQNTTDLSRFERGDFVPSGTYSVDLYLNNRLVGRSEVRFAAPSSDASATPCVTPALLDQLGLHPAELSPATTAALASSTACVDMATVIPGASLSFQMSDLRLDTSVPQAYLGLAARGYVDPKYWDSGVTAGLLNYNFNSYRTSGQGLTQTSSYLGLNAGLNLGRWHLRHDSSLTWQSAAGVTRASRHWQNIATYAQRDLPSLRAQLTVGDSWTSGEIFDSIGLRGVQIATDDRMLPQSQRGYAPTVRGIADSNAKVTVRQNGMVIYQTTVAPGPFAIDDLYATGYGGDFEVSVTEASGRVHTFSVPYASVPQLLRPGTTRFSVAAGQLRDSTIMHKPGVVQATVQHGFTNLLTGYAGAAGATGYGELLLGGALNTRYGALALDATTARTRIPGLGTLSGQSVRLSYSKTLAETGTSLTVAAYRYSTSGYLSLGDAMRARDYAKRNLPVFASGPTPTPTINGVPISGLLSPEQQAALAGIDLRKLLTPVGVDRQRNNFSLTLSQRLGEHGGSLYVSGSTRNYWNRPGRDTQYQVGYNNSLGRTSYSVSASRERDLFGHSDNRFMLSLNIPLGAGEHSPSLSGGFSHDSSGNNQAQATLSGTAGVDNRFSYGATLARDNGDGAAGTTGSLNAGYRNSHVAINAGFGAGSGYSQASLGVVGSIVAYPGGISFGQMLGDTVAIVQVPGAAGARITNAAGVTVNRAGYALVPYLTPYQLNAIDIDPTGLPLDVQLDSTSTQVAPRAGAVVLVKFKTESGRFVLIQAHTVDGLPLPFGAEVSNAQGQPVGMVGQAGRIMARLSEATGTLSVHWQDDDGNAKQCALPYQLPARGKPAGPGRQLEQIDATCAAPRAMVALAGSTP
ncbi:MAG: fimbria/pilus outer membrane usher protein [Rhodanobacter sp.]|uniref:fimbria/pilus outer membrane usher protein n=1 Tax=Rhodanobacter sp. KK11 TaxID=3083255 RepID=UPI002966E616|nr:fimbria/pilus outer membrane usher protein [Rhodanobacter sp. KK11]MDW2982969.1 fimbria/pilus outer membrane usher protein [Rhodanobacter sp. KK11]